VLIKVGDQFGDHETGGDIAPHDLSGVLCEGHQKVCCPEAVAEEIRDQGPLCILLVDGDSL